MMQRQTFFRARRRTQQIAVLFLHQELQYIDVTGRAHVLQDSLAVQIGHAHGGAMADQDLYDSQVPTARRFVQGSAPGMIAGIDIGMVLEERFRGGHATVPTGQVQGCASCAVGSLHEVNRFCFCWVRRKKLL